MKHVYLVTSNEQKFTEARERLANVSPDVRLDQMLVDIPEVQSENPDVILKHKIDYIRSKTELPFVVDNASFDTGRYSGFPGSYAKFVNSTLGREGWEKLFEDSDSVRATARVALCYLDTVYYFDGQVDGELHFDGSNSSITSNILSQIMYVSPGITLGAALQNSDFDNHRCKAFAKLGEWLNAQNEQEASQKNDIGERWSQRSSDWKDMIENTDSYVNFEDNYARVNSMIRKYAPVTAGKALEIGCGTGEAGRILKQGNPTLDVLSTDIAESMLDEAEKQTRESGLDIKYKKVDIATDDLGKDSYSMILSRGVIISHLPKNDVMDYLESITHHTMQGGYFLFDFIQDIQVGDVEKPVDSKNEFTLEQMDGILRELGWNRVDDDGTDNMRVRVVCYRKKEI